MKVNKLLIKSIVLFLIGPGIVLYYLPYLIINKTGFFWEARSVFVYCAFVFWLIGVYLILKSVESFIYRGEGTPAPWDAPKNLVNREIYKFNRNPMYTGALLFLFGDFVWTQNIWLLVYTGFWWLVFHCFVIFYEEPGLKKQFGQPYQEYMSKTPRWWLKFEK